MSQPPLTNREAIAAAAAILRKGQCPPKHIAAPIIERLDAITLAMSMSDEPSQGGSTAQNVIVTSRSGEAA